MPPKGTYFYVWQMPTVGTADKLLQTIAPWKDKITGLFLKVNEAAMCMNQYNENLQKTNNDAYLLQWIQQIRAAGLEVEGWGYVYPDNPGPQGDRIEERREKLDLSRYLVDAEVEWKVGYGVGAKVRTLMDKLHNGSFDVGLTSYRYPELHQEFPFAQFLKHVRTDFNSPQVYWLGRHDPVIQTLESLSQYQVIEGGTKPFVPSACAFGQKLQNGDYWLPTTDDLENMQRHCIKFYGGIVWWSLDWIISHQRWDWMDTICGVGSMPPPPPPPQPNEIIPIKQVIVTADALNIRSLPSALARDTGTLPKNSDVGVLAEQDGWYNIGCGWIKASYTRNK